VCPESVEHDELPLPKPESQEMLDVNLEKAFASVAPWMHMASPIPQRLMEAISVVFLPRFLGTLP